MRTASVGSIGELLVELVSTSKNGRHRRVGTYLGPFPSGAPGIFIDQAAQVSGRAIFVGAVGGDAFGHVLLDRLRDDGVTLDLVQVVPDWPTGTAFVSYNDDGSRDFVFNIAHSAASHFPDEAAVMAGLRAFGVDVMHVSGSSLPDPFIVKTCRALHAEGVRISFDPNIRKELIGVPGYLDDVRDLTAISAFFLPSEEDAAVLYPGEDIEAFSARLFAGSAEHVVLKRGAAGCRGLSRDGARADFAGHKVEVEDVTGAGDCFCATFVALMASGSFSLAEALLRANAAGALAVTKIGPMEGNSTLAEIEAFLAEREG